MECDDITSQSASGLSIFDQIWLVWQSVWVLHCLVFFLVILASHGLCKGMLAAIFDLNLSGVFVPNISHQRNHDESLRSQTCCVYLQLQIDVPLSNMWIKKVWLMALSDHLSTSVIICHLRWPHVLTVRTTWDDQISTVRTPAPSNWCGRQVLEKNSIQEYREQYNIKHTILRLGKIHMGWNNCVTTFLMQWPDWKKCPRRVFTGVDILVSN